MSLTAELPSKTSAPARREEPGRSLRRFWLETFGILWVLLAAGAAMAPALVHGTSLGSIDWASQFGLMQRGHLVVHNPQVSDQADLFIPWMSAAWHEVHQGHLPLWNPYSAWGMPLAFNWQSTAFSLPAVLGYLFPLNLDYTVQVLVTLVIAGTGVYVLGRILRLGVLGSVLAATIYELSGPFFGWLGWPFSSVMSWAGWLFVGAILIMRGRHRVRSVALSAVVLALAIYGGYPEADVLLAIALVLFVIVVAVSQGRSLGWRPIGWRLVDLATAAVAGVLLAAPLVLPGLQLASGSIRNVSISGNSSASPAVGSALSLHNLFHIIFQGFDGLPVAGSKWFGDPIYLFTAMYLGVIAVVLGVVGTVARWRRAEVRAFALIAVVSGGLVFFQPLVSIMHALPGAEGFRWYEASMTMALAVALLAGFGIDALVRARTTNVASWTFAGFGVFAVILAAIWLLGRGHLPPAEAAIRSDSFVWPAAEVLVGLGAVGGLFFVLRRRSGSPPRERRWLDPRRWCGISLLACESAFLITAGAPLWSSSQGLYKATPSVTAFQRAVGTSIVAFGTPDCYTPPGYGIPQDVNIFFGVQELAVHDPLTPAVFYSGWRKAAGKRSSLPSWQAEFQTYCPGVNSASLARLVGASFVLERASDPGPPGSSFVMAVGDEALYRISGVAVATLTPLTGTHQLPPTNAAGTPLNVTHPKPETWQLVETSTSPSILRLRLSDVPGWHASIDGKPLALRSFSEMMLQARVPAGRHVVVLTYWPTSFSFGIAMALVSAAFLAVALFLGKFLRRRHPGT